MDEEELAELNEQLASARAEIERLQRDAANAETRAAEAIAYTESLREEVLATESARSDAQARAAALQADLDEAGEREHAAAKRYRDLVLKSEQALPEHLIGGDTINAVDASVEAAREIVGRVRTHLEAQSQSSRVPAGAPPRSAPDLSAMTPEQKIRYGLEHRGDR